MTEKHWNVGVASGIAWTDLVNRKNQLEKID
jgi:hypothetical protein